MENFVGNLSAYLGDASLLAYPAAFVAGVLISFTPCVYPVIPIQLGFIGARTAKSAQNSEIRSRFDSRALTLSILFVIGMSVVYAALGAFAGLTGTLFGTWAASPWTYLIVANVILLMALSMFGVFSISAPQFLSKWNPRGNGYGAALLVGASSALVVGPCTAPALGATLAYVGAQGSVLFGTSVLFVFALGMGVLMIVLGAFGGAIAALPRSGAWLERVKVVFAVLMLVVAQYFLLETGRRLI